MLWNNVSPLPPPLLLLLLTLQSCVLAAGDAAVACGARAIVGLGGGSSLDVAKVVALLAGKTEQTLGELYGVDKCRGMRLPLVQIPTTAGTGSEVTPISILTTGENAKMGIVSPLLYPDVALLDAELTMSVPAHVTAATGIDAMVHAVEACTSRTLKNGISDMFAKQALALLAANIRRVCANGDDAKARQDMLLGSTYAGMAFANAPVAAVHALAYPIGSHFKVPHGLSNAIMLPHVLRFNAEDPETARIYAELCDICFPDSTRWPSDVHGAHALADGFATLSSDLGIATTLQEVGIVDQDLDLLAVEALKQERLLPNNPVPVRLEDAIYLYRQAF
jgi:alcohol dehydrogenase class IV